jgi:metal-responsive CopG/Arc/MetJ family transcriptional regulator
MSHRLQVLIPPELDAEIDKAAQRSLVSKGEWVRRALKESLRRAGSESKNNPVERMAALACPAGDIDQILAEIDDGFSGILGIRRLKL